MTLNKLLLFSFLAAASLSPVVAMESSFVIDTRSSLQDEKESLNDYGYIGKKLLICNRRTLDFLIHEDEPSMGQNDYINNPKLLVHHIFKRFQENNPFDLSEFPEAFTLEINIETLGFNPANIPNEEMIEKGSELFKEHLAGVYSRKQNDFFERVYNLFEDEVLDGAHGDEDETIKTLEGLGSYISSLEGKVASLEKILGARPMIMSAPFSRKAIVQSEYITSETSSFKQTSKPSMKSFVSPIISYDIWFSMEEHPLEDFICLSLGKDPQNANYHKQYPDFKERLAFIEDQSDLSYCKGNEAKIIERMLQKGFEVPAQVKQHFRLS